MTAVEILQSGQPRRALPMLAKKAKRDPSYGNLLNLASAQRACWMFDATEETLLKCLALSDRRPEAWNNLAQLATDLGEFEKAPMLFQKAAQCAFPDGPEAPATFHTPGVKEIMLGFSQSLMRLEFFKEAWPMWEASRLGTSWQPIPGVPVWQGETGKRVLVMCEGGYGDAMLFARWLPMVKTLASHVSLLLWDKLLDWCEWGSIGVDTLCPMSKPLNPEDYDYCTSWMSLPAIFKMESVEDIPACIEPPCLSENLGMIGNWAGLCWQAEENGQIRKVRSLDDHTAGRIAKARRFVSLCPRSKNLAKKAGHFKVPFGVVQNHAQLDGWKRTTSLIQVLQYVVTVDTAVAHLAGICGVPTLVLLPRRSDWKWGIRGDTSWWYGPHLRLFRNQSASVWDCHEIETSIKSLIENK